MLTGRSFPLSSLFGMDGRLLLEHYEKKRPSYAKKRERRGKNLPAGLEAIAGLVSCGSVDLANGH